ncbi:MAG: 2OG-Fe(II) oxygenase family protein [Nitrospiraceae bacterium]
MTVLQTCDALDTFSFHEQPVLVVEQFLHLDERQHLREGMAQANWKALRDIPQTREDFPNSGNWEKAEIQPPYGRFLMERLALPCIKNYVESFPNITGLHIGFSYYSYGAGDCLLTHDDTAQGGGGPRAPRRRLAAVLYLHEEWHPDWGGELIVYDTRRPGGRATGAPQGGDGRTQPSTTEMAELRISHCIAPRPGSLVVFTVPRFHRVCRVDPTAGAHKRLSIAGWFMTQH